MVDYESSSRVVGRDMGMRTGRLLVVDWEDPEEVLIFGVLDADVIFGKAGLFY